MKADLVNFPSTWMANSAAQTGGKVVINGKVYDFSGLGNADQQGAISDTMAKALLDIQKNYGADFVKQRLADLQRSDPTGFAARKQLFDKILEDSQKGAPNQQMSEDLQGQVNTMLQGTGGLDEQGRQEVQNSVRGRQAARGIILGNAPAQEEAQAVVQAQDTLRTQQQQSAEDYLKSGISPQDIQFRKIQQDLANLGAFQNGQTPEAQFGQLAGAGNGAAPFSTPNYSNPASLNPNAAGIGINFAQSNFSTSQQNANPFMAGAGMVIGGINNIANSGFFSRPATSPYVSSFNSFSSSPAAQVSYGNAFSTPASPSSGISYENAYSGGSGSVGLNATL